MGYLATLVWIASVSLVSLVRAARAGHVEALPVTPASAVDTGR
ncbi:MAG TPA: hypothetical protein VNJ28_05400 [Candidatus Limnocylindrales bacterium]|nr:hypothetical protein [Candidatus Limnocylindrales bacterium]